MAQLQSLCDAARRLRGRRLQQRLRLRLWERLLRRGWHRSAQCLPAQSSLLCPALRPQHVLQPTRDHAQRLHRHLPAQPLLAQEVSRSHHTAGVISIDNKQFSVVFLGNQTDCAARSNSTAMVAAHTLPNETAKLYVTKFCQSSTP